MEIESETISSKVDKIISISSTNDYVKLLDEPYEHAKYLQTLIREYYRSDYDVIKLSKLLDLMYECNYGVNENGELYLKMIKTECIYLKLQAFKLFRNHLNSEVPEHHEILNKFIFNVPFVPKVDSSILPSGFRIDHDSIYFTAADLVEFDINTPNNLLRYQCAIEVIKVLQNRNISINETLFSSIKYTFKYYYDNIESFYDNLKNDFNLINNFVRYSIEIVNILYGKTDHDLIRSIIVLTFNIVTNASSSCKASFLSMLLSKKEFGLSVEMVIDKNHFLIGTNESVKILYVKFVSSIIELNKSKQLLSHLEGQLLNIASRIKLNLSDVAYENENDTTYSNIILMNTIIRSYVQLIYNILNDKIDYQPKLKLPLVLEMVDFFINFRKPRCETIIRCKDKISLDDAKIGFMSVDDAKSIVGDFIFSYLTLAGRYNVQFSFDDKFILKELFIAPVKLMLNFECEKFYGCFLNFGESTFNGLLGLVVNDLIVKYYSRINMWKGLMNMGNNAWLIVCKEANRLVYDDVIFESFKHFRFYKAIFPICYEFFMYDKQHYKTFFANYFPVIFKSFINLEENPRFTIKQMSILMWDLFHNLNQKTTYYAGYCCMYSHIELVINEFYHLYCIFCDTQYLRVLFSLPSSFCLMVTRYPMFKKPIIQSLRTDLVLDDQFIKFIEHLAEFDSNVFIKEILGDIFILLNSNNPIVRKNVMKILTKFSGRHIEILNPKLNEGNRSPYEDMYENFVEMLIGLRPITVKDSTFNIKSKFTVKCNINDRFNITLVNYGTMVDSNIDKNHVRDCLMDYLNDFDNIVNSSLLCSKIFLGLLIDESESSFKYSIKFVRSSYDSLPVLKVVLNCFYLAAIYSRERMIRFMTELDSPFLFNRLYNTLTAALYHNDDLIRYSSLYFISLVDLEILDNDNIHATISSIRFILSNLDNNRIYNMCKDVIGTLLNTYEYAREIMVNLNTIEINNMYLTSIMIDYYKLKDITHSLTPDTLINDKTSITFYENLYNAINNYLVKNDPKENKNNAVFIRIFNLIQKLKRLCKLNIYPDLNFLKFSRLFKATVPAIGVLDEVIIYAFRNELLSRINNDNSLINDSKSLVIIRNILFNYTIPNNIKSFLIQLYEQHPNKVIFNIICNLSDHNVVTVLFVLDKSQEMVSNPFKPSHEMLLILHKIKDVLKCKNKLENSNEISRSLLERIDIPIFRLACKHCITINDTITKYIIEHLSTIINSINEIRGNNNVFKNTLLLHTHLTELGVKGFYLLEYLSLNSMKYRDSRAVIEILTICSALFDIKKISELTDYYLNIFSNEELEELYKAIPILIIRNPIILNRILKCNNNSLKFKLFPSVLNLIENTYLNNQVFDLNLLNKSYRKGSNLINKDNQTNSNDNQIEQFNISLNDNVEFVNFNMTNSEFLDYVYMNGTSYSYTNNDIFNLDLLVKCASGSNFNESVKVNITKINNNLDSLNLDSLIISYSDNIVILLELYNKIKYFSNNTIKVAKTIVLQPENDSFTMTIALTHIILFDKYYKNDMDVNMIINLCIKYELFDLLNKIFDINMLSRGLDINLYHVENNLPITLFRKLYNNLNNNLISLSYNYLRSNIGPSSYVDSLLVINNILSNTDFDINFKDESKINLLFILNTLNNNNFIINNRLWSLFNCYYYQLDYSIIREIFIKYNDTLEFNKNINKMIIDNDIELISRNTLNFANMITALEILLTRDDNTSLKDKILDLFNRIITSNYPNPIRFNFIFNLIIKLFPNEVCNIVLNYKLGYPPLLNALYKLFYCVDMELAIELCNFKASRLLKECYYNNLYHLLMLYPNLITSNIRNIINSGDLNLIKLIINIDETRSDDLFEFLKFLFRIDYMSDNNNGILGINNSEISNMVMDKKNFINAKDIQFIFITVILFHFKFNVDVIQLIKNSSDIFSIFKNVLDVALGLISEEQKEELVKLYFNNQSLLSFYIESKINIGNLNIINFSNYFIIRNSCAEYFDDAFKLKYLESYDDIEYFLGYVKIHSKVRELKLICKLMILKEYRATYFLLRTTLQKITKRSVSYSKNDMFYFKRLHFILTTELGKGNDQTDTVIRRTIEYYDDLWNESIYFCKNSSDVILDTNDLPIKDMGRRTFKSLEGFYVMHNPSILMWQFMKVNQMIFEYFNDVFNKENGSDDVNYKRVFLKYIFSVFIDNCSCIIKMPKSKIFNDLLFNLTLVGEMIDSISMFDGRNAEMLLSITKIWNNRSPIDEFIFFNKWRMLILEKIISIVSANDKKRVLGLICKNKFSYTKYLMDNGEYKMAQLILNDINNLPTIELNQKMRKLNSELECCYNTGEYQLIPQIVGSINIGKFKKTDRGLFYFWVFKAYKMMEKENIPIPNSIFKLHGLDSEGLLKFCRPFYSADSFKDEDLSKLKKQYRNNIESIDKENSINHLYCKKLIEIIEDLPIDKSRMYVLELIKIDPLAILKISAEKMYYFNNLIKSKKVTELVHKKYPFLVETYFKIFSDFNNSNELVFDKPIVLPGEYDILRNDYTNLKRVFSIVERLENDLFVIRLKDGCLYYCDYTENFKIVKKREMINTALSEKSEMLTDRVNSLSQNDNVKSILHDINKLKESVNCKDGSLRKCIELTNTKIGLDIVLPKLIGGVFIYKYYDKKVDNNIKGLFTSISPLYRTYYTLKKNFIKYYSSQLFYQLLTGSSFENIYVNLVKGYCYYKNLDSESTNVTIKDDIVNFIELDGLNGHVLMILYNAFKWFIESSDAKEIFSYFYNLDDVMNKIENNFINCKRLNQLFTEFNLSHCDLCIGKSKLSKVLCSCKFVKDKAFEYDNLIMNFIDCFKIESYLNSCIRRNE